MKKRRAFILVLVLAGAVFAGSNLYANEDIDQYIKGNHLKVLHSLGIEAEAKDLENMKTVTDKTGKKWLFNEFTNSTPLIEKMDKEFVEDVGGSFIEIQDEIMQKYAKVGDTIPAILLDETLKEGSFSFIREDGEMLIFKLKYDNGSWKYEKQK